MLQKSRMDIIEYGIMCSYTAGLDSSVYATTNLPSNLVRQEQQMYAVLLDLDSRPLLSSVPARSEQTADIIRMSFSSEREQEDIDYCLALQQKGYLVAILVNETARYGEDELVQLLRKLNALKPWACYIYDTSGILTEQSLRRTLAVYARELSNYIRIGFQGRDSLQILPDLAAIFLSYKMEHERCLDVSLKGIARGALQLSSEKTALWLNKEYGKNYSILELEYQASFLEGYVHHQKTIGAKLLYSFVAKEKCSYRYAEYYSDLSLDIVDQLNVFAEIDPKAAFKFNKREANAAIVSARKKSFKLGMFIFTQDHPERVLEQLADSMPKLLKYGIDVVVCDSSRDDRTKSIVSNYQIDGYCNIFYLPVPRGVQADSAETVVAAAKLFKDYDYIWPSRDDLIPDIEGFYINLTALAEEKVEWIVIDASSRNNGRKTSKIYKNCLDFFSENSARLAILGTSIFGSGFLTKVIERQKSADSFNPFSLITAALGELAVSWTQTALFIGSTFFYKNESLPQNMIGLDAFEIWGQRWYEAISGLPEVYDPAKCSAVRFQAIDMYPFRIKSLLRLRSCGKFGVRFYRQNRVRLGEVSDISTWKYYVVALMPKTASRLICKAIESVAVCPKSRSSRIFERIYKVYQKLGRK